MTRSRTLVVGLVGLVVLVGLGIGAYVVYDQVLRGDAAPALSLPSAALSDAAPSEAASSGPPASPPRVTP